MLYQRSPSLDQLVLQLEIGQGAAHLKTEQMVSFPPSTRYHHDSCYCWKSYASLQCTAIVNERAPNAQGLAYLRGPSE